MGLRQRMRFHREIMRGSDFERRKFIGYVRGLLSGKPAFENPEYASTYLEFIVGAKFYTAVLRAEMRRYFKPTRELNEISETDFYAEVEPKKGLDILQRRFLKYLDWLLSVYQERDPVEDRLEALKNTFFLNDIEIEIVTYLFLVTTSSSFEDKFNCGLDKNIHKELGFKKHEVDEVLEKGNLVKSQIISEENHRRLTYELPRWVIKFLYGRATNNFLAEFYVEFTGKSLDYEKHLVGIEEKQLLVDFASRPEGVNILFYGEPGTGKTELAKALAARLGKRLYIVNSPENSEAATLQAAVIAACNTTDSKGSIILVDEADGLLNTIKPLGLGSMEGSFKAWLNHFLEGNGHKVIWITNRIHYMEPSVMRRFDLALKFDRMNRKQKVRIFTHILKESSLDGLLSEQEIERISAKYQVNAGGIVDAIKNLKAVANDGDRQVFIRKLEVILKHHEIAILGGEPSNSDFCETGVYNLNALHTSQNLDQLITALKNNASPGKNITLLLYGLPGTGKTQFVMHLAKELGKELKLKRASDLLSMWVGGTEKAMAGAFKEAAADDAILFLDEADSFFYPRESAMHSWEKTQVNELLTQMERFKGVFICATNMIKGLDEAAIRRFNFKIEFRPLTPDGILAMYKLHLEGLADSPLTNEEQEEVKSLPLLAPGDFNAVAKRYGLLGKTESHKELITALRDEVGYKSNRRDIGF